MRVGSNFVQNANYSQQKNIENRQNKQKMGFGSLNMAELKKTMGEPAFDHLKDNLIKGCILGNVAKAVESTNAFLLKIWETNPIFKPERKKLEYLLKQLNFQLQLHKLEGKVELDNLRVGSRNKTGLKLITETKIPEPIDIIMTSGLASNERGYYAKREQVASIRIGKVNLHDELIKLPQIKNIQQDIKNEKASFFILKGEEFEHEISNPYEKVNIKRPLPCDDETNELLDKLFKSQINIDNESFNFSGCTRAKLINENDRKQQESIGNNVTGIVNDLLFPKK